MTAVLDAQRRQTKAYIENDPTIIELIPTVTTVLANGGKSRDDGITRRPQQFKMIVAAYDQRPVITVDGVERIISYTLLGEWDCEMEVWDHWVTDGCTYTVVALGEGYGYSKKGLVERHLPVS